MSEITLSNFGDLLDPDTIDAGKSFADSGKLLSFQIKGDNIWKATFEEKKQTLKVRVEMQQKQVSLIHCECKAHDDELWEEDPCLHAVAVLFAIKNGLPEKKIKATAPKTTGKASTTEKAKKALEKPVKVKKDPALALLDTLEKHDMVSFITQMFTQNKEFKSQFMLHFASDNDVNAAQYEALVKQAISAVKGRKKYLSGAEAGKIASALSTLYKQAATAEAQGHLMQAHVIVESLLTPLIPISYDMQSSSARFNTFLTNCFELRSQIIKNPTLPFDLKESIYKHLYHTYSNTSVHSEFEPQTYQNLLDIARLLKRQDKIIELLESTLQRVKVNQTVYWGHYAPISIRLIKRLVDLYDIDLEKPEKSDLLLKSQSSILVVLFTLVNRKLAQNLPDEVLIVLKEFESNRKKYHSQIYAYPNIEQHVLDCYIKVYQLNGSTKELADVASKSFVKSNYKIFEYYELEKTNTDPSEWATRVQTYLKLTSPKGKNIYFDSDPYFEILKKEEMYDEIRDYLFTNGTTAQWASHGHSVLDGSSKEYVAQLKLIILNELKSKTTYHSEYAISILIQNVANQREYHDEMMEFTKELLKGFPYNYGLQAYLKQVLE